MVPRHVQAEGGTGPAGCGCGVFSRRKGRSRVSQGREVFAAPPCLGGGVCCPLLLEGWSAPRCWGKCLLTLWGRLCHLLCAWEPAPCSCWGLAGCMFLSSGLGPTLRCTFPSPVSSSTSVSGPCPVCGVWPVGLPRVSSWGGCSSLGPLWGAPGASRVTVISPG